jgi:hypothetical protein
MNEWCADIMNGDEKGCRRSYHITTKTLWSLGTIEPERPPLGQVTKASWDCEETIRQSSRCGEVVRTARAHGASPKVRSVAATDSKSGYRSVPCSSPPPPQMIMPLDPIEFDFGLCSTEILPLTSSTQHTLHPS